MLSRPCSLPQSPALAPCKGRETRCELGSQAVDIARLLGDGRHRGATESEFSPCCQGAAEAAASVVFFTVSARLATLAGATPGQAAESGTSTPSPEGTAIENSVSGSGPEGPLLYL
jgi:hypothetical protein